MQFREKYYIHKYEMSCDISNKYVALTSLFHLQSALQTN